MAREESARRERADVSGSDLLRQETAEGPVAGLEPGERVERGTWQPPVESDPPPTPADEAAAAHEPAGPQGNEGFVEPDTGAPPPDPGAAPEDEGIPDLQDGTPTQQRAADPQQEPVPGDSPTAATRAAPTPNEMREGETMDERLAQEEPEHDTVSGTPSDPAGPLDRPPEQTPPRHQDVHADRAADDGTPAEGLAPEEEATRTVDENTLDENDV